MAPFAAIFVSDSADPRRIGELIDWLQQMALSFGPRPWTSDADSDESALISVSSDTKFVDNYAAHGNMTPSSESLQSEATDHDRIIEVIREKLFLRCHREVPHQTVIVGVAWSFYFCLSFSSHANS